MIARYRPALDVAAWWSFLACSDPASARQQVVLRLGGPRAHRAHAFVSARQALFAYLSQLRRRAGSAARVLLSAQICPVVPELVRHAGLEPAFVDLDSSFPTPLPESFARGVDANTLAVVLSPMYGFFPRGWDAFLDKLGTAKLVLDLAQGLLLGDRIEQRLLQRADAVVYSFALGKGLDTGGGLIFSEDLDPDLTRGARWDGQWATLAGALALGTIQALGLYGPLVGRLEGQIEAGKRFTPKPHAGAAERCFCLWHARLLRFEGELERARLRASAIRKLPEVQRRCRDVEILCGPESTHLRQIIRLPPGRLQAQVLSRLRGAGVDCAAAGEPLPSEYDRRFSSADFPNASRFRLEAIRLPFLGRLAEPAFEFICQRLQDTLRSEVGSPEV